MTEQNTKQPEHIESPDCWCEPEMFYEDEETGVQCWVHKEMQ